MRRITGSLVLLAIAASCAAGESAAPWTGFYAGFSVGASWDESHLAAGHWNFLQATPYSKHIGETDFLPGVQAGYNFQTTSGWV